MNMIFIPIHHTETDVIPMNNCWSWQVFAKLDWGKAWKCMSEVDYNIRQEELREESKEIWLWILWIGITAILMCILWYWISERF